MIFQEDIVIRYAAKIDILTFGKMIHQKRTLLGLTEEQLAEYSDLSDREIRNIEKGKSIPKLDSVLKIAHALDIDVGELTILIQMEDFSYV